MLCCSLGFRYSVNNNSFVPSTTLKHLFSFHNIPHHKKHSYYLGTLICRFPWQLGCVFLCPVHHITFHILFAVVLFQNELITALLGCPAVQNDREPQMMCNGLTCLFILDPTVHL